MAFDQPTRNRLQRFVNDARRVLEEEFTRQLQNDYGMDPNAGSVTELASLRHINDSLNRGGFLRLPMPKINHLIRPRVTN